MKRSFVVKCLTVILLVSGCFLVAGAYAADKVITLRFAHFVPSTTLEGKTMQDWANEVEKEDER